MLKFLIYILGYSFFSFIGLFIKVNKRIFLFSGLGDGYNGSPRAIYEYLEKNDNYICYWLTRRRDVYKYLKEDGKKIAYLYSLRGIGLAIKSKYLIAADNNVLPYWLLSKDKIIIQTWHGTPLKALGIYEKKYAFKEQVDLFRIKRCDYLISPSDYVSELFRKCFQLTREKMILTGNPRNDILFSDLSKTKILSKINLKQELQNSKILLYCPTFRASKKKLFFPFADFDSSKLNQILEELNLICILRTHHVDSESIAESSPRILYVPAKNPNVDTQELLNIADLLITDYSSVYFDYLLLNRPIIFIPFDLEEYEADRGFLFDYNDNTPGPKVFSFSDFLKQIKMNINKPDLFEKDRMAVNGKFNKFKDNKSTERVVKIIEILREKQK